jgi:hypothetical protein
MVSLGTILFERVGAAGLFTLASSCLCRRLYLEHRSNDGDAILGAGLAKLRLSSCDVDAVAEDTRKSWREGFDRERPAPCSDRFLAAVPLVHNGDTSALLFTARTVDFPMNGRSVGRVADPDFVWVVLATFIGPSSNSAEVKEAGRPSVALRPHWATNEAFSRCALLLPTEPRVRTQSVCVGARL